MFVLAGPLHKDSLWNFHVLFEGSLKTLNDVYFKFFFLKKKV